ncbi:MAG: proton-conducting transporter membrane subunit, partial [Candidatus Omnitrophica bacterium]|nr:proton-conducting transporter membrane subunit [Candidatus Omnitrophota bacterium]
AGIVLTLVGNSVLRRVLAQLALAAVLIGGIAVFARTPSPLDVALIGNFALRLGFSPLSLLVMVFIDLFGLLVSLYSCSYRRVSESPLYFSFMLWLIAFSNLVCMSSDFLLLVFSWGATLTLLYAFLRFGSGESAAKALTVVGLGDFALLLGVCIYIASSGSALMPAQGGLALNSPLHWASFILMLTGAFAKAGCGPLHTWIPAASESAPLPVMAILPASLDKLLGIYFLARICLDFFALTPFAYALLLMVGSLTIIFAVMMALIQHDMRKLLSFHAISQVGYMVLGFGTGVPLGIAGGIFHMINHAIYKSGLFLTAGSVGQERKTFELSRLGGLGALMPVTFFTGLVFSFSISGVPPLNGFASKWMLYQGVLSGFLSASGGFLKGVHIFAILSAMFGSILTLASFIKFIHAVFLAEERPASDNAGVKEVPLLMRAPVCVLAGLCILLGLVPQFFVARFISPALGGAARLAGAWNSLFSCMLLVSALAVGAFVWKGLGRKQSIRQDAMFIGGEPAVFDPRFPATEFYRTVEDMPLMRRAYAFLKSEVFDIYYVVQRLGRTLAYALFIFVDRAVDILTVSVGYCTLGASWVLRQMHSGVLDLYLSWGLLGLIVLLFVLMGR